MVINLIEDCAIEIFAMVAGAALSIVAGATINYLLNLPLGTQRRMRRGLRGIALILGLILLTAVAVAGLVIIALGILGLALTVYGAL